MLLLSSAFHPYNMLMVYSIFYPYNVMMLYPVFCSSCTLILLYPVIFLLTMDTLRQFTFLKYVDAACSHFPPNPSNFPTNLNLPYLHGHYHSTTSLWPPRLAGRYTSAEPSWERLGEGGRGKWWPNHMGICFRSLVWSILEETGAGH